MRDECQIHRAREERAATLARRNAAAPPRLSAEKSIGPRDKAAGFSPPIKRRTRVIGSSAEESLAAHYEISPARCYVSPLQGLRAPTILLVRHHRGISSVSATRALVPRARPCNFRPRGRNDTADRRFSVSLRVHIYLCLSLSLSLSLSSETESMQR